jgi:hypothetical protein
MATRTRRGSALLIVVAALAIVSALLAAITWECVAGRRLVERRQVQLQADALARAGVELAAERLLRDPASYQGESVELLPGGRVRIEVRADPKRTDLFQVTSEARYPGDGSERVVRSAKRTFRRTSRNNEVRLEAIGE